MRINLDLLVIDAERAIIEDVEIDLKDKCKYLQKEGEFYYYCGGGIGSEPKLNQIVSARQGVAELQLYCMDRFKQCCYYKNYFAFPGLDLDSIEL
ncbi:hypothetical protein CL622_01680 [archaeon]|nr:hypothetical protein [archaeon]|tara:strand:+ start:844 stop:1128 length:285 start_codon:yes stop_codon:yes gene_type:complete